MLKPGDVVMLKSGGPIMTVREAEITRGDVRSTYCHWFDRRGELQGGRFTVEMLTASKSEITAHGAFHANALKVNP